MSTAEADRASTHAGRARRIRHGLVIGGVVVFVVWAVAAAVTLLMGSLQAREGVQRLEDAREQLSAEDLLRGEGRNELESALAEFERAHDRGGSPLLWPLRPLPVVGRQLDAFTSMADATSSTLEAGLRGIEQVNREVPDDVEIPSDERAAVLRTVASIAGDLDDEIAAADLGPAEGLVGPLADARRRLTNELDGLQLGLERGIAAASGLAEVFDADGNYLMLMTNNAEMRAGSPMILRLGQLEFDDGSLSLTGLREPGPPLEEPVEADEELLANWGWLEPAQWFRHAGVTPRFDVVAPLAERIWRAKGGAPVEGVFSLDVVALQSILEATGPIVVEGREIDASNLIEELFIEQYAEEVDRFDLQGEIARAVVDALDDGDWNLATMAEQLRLAANGRHLLLWSADPEQQRAWEQADLSGSLDADSLMVSVLNIGGNKLDPFLALDAELFVAEVDDGWLVTLDLELRNDAPEPGTVPAPVLGPYPGTGSEPGEYLGVATIHVPGDARGLRLEGGDRGLVRGGDGPSAVVGSLLRLERGTERELRVQFLLPPEQRTIVVEPSTRVPRIDWTAGELTWTDDAREGLRW